MHDTEDAVDGWSMMVMMVVVLLSGGCACVGGAFIILVCFVNEASLT
jgi:hypothetical protein